MKSEKLQVYNLPISRRIGLGKNSNYRLVSWKWKLSSFCRIEKKTGCIRLLHKQIKITHSIIKLYWCWCHHEKKFNHIILHGRYKYQNYLSNCTLQLLKPRPKPSQNRSNRKERDNFVAQIIDINSINNINNIIGSSGKMRFTWNISDHINVGETFYFEKKYPRLWMKLLYLYI